MNRSEKRDLGILAMIIGMIIEFIGLFTPPPVWTIGFGIFLVGIINWVFARL